MPARPTGSVRCRERAPLLTPCPAKEGLIDAKVHQLRGHVERYRAARG
jgi:hypothetical protein